MGQIEWKRGVRQAALLVPLLLSLLLVSASRAVGQGAERGAEADSLVAAFFTEHRVPALSIAVMLDGEMAYRTTLGLADVENNVPAGPETVFRIASVTKPITAVGVLRLADTGRLDLDAAIQEYCAAYPAKRWAVTARDLLSHVAGLRDYTRIERGVWRVKTVGGFQIGSSTVYVPDIGEAVSVFAGDSLVFEPGTAYRYSNFGYVLLGCAIEGASGRSYSEFMDAEIWGPARMTRTVPNDAWAVILDRARNYQMRTEQNADWWWFTPAQKEVMNVGELYNSRYEDTSHKLSAGGLLSTAGDLVRFGAAAMRGVLLSDSMRTAMLVERSVPGEAPGESDGTGWGLGWSVEEVNGHRIAGLGGGQAGVSAIIVTLPDHDFVISAVANRDFVPLSDLTRTLAGVWGFDLTE